MGVTAITRTHRMGASMENPSVDVRERVWDTFEADRQSLYDQYQDV